MQRRPPKRWYLASSSPRPMSCSCLTARGVRPSPQVFSRGNVLRSTTATSWPWRASQYAADAPAGPAPTTRTSYERVLGTGCSDLGRRADALFVERLLACADGLELGRGRRAPVGELLHVLRVERVGTGDREALVADDGDDLRVREGAAVLGALLGHEAAVERAALVRSAGTVRVAVDLARVGGAAGVDERGLVLELREGLQD